MTEFNDARPWLIVSADPHSVDDDGNMEPNEDIGTFATIDEAEEKLKQIMVDEDEQQFSDECDLPLFDISSCLDVLENMGTSNYYQIVNTDTGTEWKHVWMETRQGWVEMTDESELDEVECTICEGDTIEAWPENRICAFCQ